jgi:hypothetical protein
LIAAVRRPIGHATVTPSGLFDRAGAWRLTLPTVKLPAFRCLKPRRRSRERAVSARYLRGLGDTSILIFLERLEADDLPSELAVSAVSLAELSAGVHSAVDAVERARRTVRVQRVEATFSPLPFDVEAARQYGIIAAVISVGRKPRGRIADLMIASIAAANRLPLFTRTPQAFTDLSPS